MKAAVLLRSILLMILAAPGVFGQVSAAAPVRLPTAPLGEADALRVAQSMADYPVTPGDRYVLSYWQAGVQTSQSIVVQSPREIDLGVFGTIDASDLTFAQLRPRVAALVSRAYARSLPFLAISAVGGFRVRVGGDIDPPRLVPAWGFTRLSEIFAAVAGPDTSVRDVAVLGEDGRTRHYDLFAAGRQGGTDPCVKPGDTVLVNRTRFVVRVQGEVRQPGRYELLPGESLGTLLQQYAGGLTPAADAGRVLLDRVEGDDASLDPIDLRQPAAASTPLADGDVLEVPSKTDSLPFVYFEGAVEARADSAGASPAFPSAAPPYNRIARTLRPGETLRTALLEVRTSLSPLADLRAATVQSSDGRESTPVDLEKLMLSGEPAIDVTLRPFDRVVIPAKRFIVTVAGSVTTPGVYPWAPHRSWQYFAALAGSGSVIEDGAAVRIEDSRGQRRDPSEPIAPEDTITVSPPGSVTVWGGVVAPGNYPYRPGLDAASYISLAGGVDSTRSASGRVTVTDRNGRTRSAGDPIQPGDRVRVTEDSLPYTFNQYFPMLSFGLAVVATAVTVTQILVQFPK